MSKHVRSLTCPILTFSLSLSLCVLYSGFSDSRDEAINGMSWLRGETGEQGLHSLNFQSGGVFPWMQQRVDPSFLRNDLNQQYQAMLAVGLQNLGSGDPLKQQFMQFQQQPVQFLQPSGSLNPLLQQHQQVMQQQPIPPHILQGQTQVLPENLPEPYLVQRQQSSVPSPSFPKTDFNDSTNKFSPSNMQNMLGSLLPEASGDLLNFTRTGQSMLEPHQQSWATKFTQSPVDNSSSSVSLAIPYKEAALEQETCSLSSQNQALFSPNIDSSGLLLPTTVSNIGTSSIDADISSMPLGGSGFQNSLYGYMQDSELLDAPTNPNRTFVKVKAHKRLICVFCYYVLVLRVMVK